MERRFETSQEPGWARHVIMASPEAALHHWGKVVVLVTIVCGRVDHRRSLG